MTESPDKQNTPKPSEEKEPTLLEIFSTLRYKEQYGNLMVHVFILAPVATFLAWLGRRLDKQWGFEPLVGSPYSFIVAFALFAIGCFVVWYSYGYLYLMGHGSSGSHMGYTQKLVDTGIYSWIRHPSVVGKLIGVIGLSFLMQTPSFLFFIIPILLLYSIVTNIMIQERFCVENFGEDYKQYRKEVPMFIPKISRVLRFFSERKGRK